MTDLKLLDKYVEGGTAFIDPRLFRKVQERGLVYLVNGLPNDEKKAKAIIRARMAKEGKAYGDPEIDDIASAIKRLEYLRESLIGMNMADPHDTLPVIIEMKELSEYVQNYYK